MPPARFSDLEKEMYARNIEYFLKYTIDENIDYDYENRVKIVAGYDLKLKKFSVDYLTPEHNEDLKSILQDFLYYIISSLDFNNPDELKITLKDYIEYVQKSRQV